MLIIEVLFNNIEIALAVNVLLELFQIRNRFFHKSYIAIFFKMYTLDLIKDPWLPLSLYHFVVISPPNIHFDVRTNSII